MEAVVNLCDTRKSYTELVDILVSAWERAASVIRRRTPDYTINILHWVLKHTLHIMLHSDWKDISEDKRNSIKDNVVKTLIEVPETSYSHYRCQYILNNIDNPWGSDSFSKVINGDSEEVTDSDLEFFTSERGCMIVLRLQKLVQIKCYPAAFVLSSKVIKAYKQIDEHHSLRKSTSLHQYSYLFDLYLALLLKYGHLTEIVEEVKVLSSKQALQVIRRNLMTTGKCARLIKYHPRVARLAAEILLAKLMEDNIEESNESDYCDILKEWFMIHKDTETLEFRTVAGKLFATAKSKHHIYLACNVMMDMHIEKWRVILLELYVRGLTADLNELELLKAERDCDEHIVIHHETDLSYRYLFLAEILKDYIPLAQECVLTAFSLNPCLPNYERVKKIAEIGGRKDNSSASNNTSTSVPDLDNAKLIDTTIVGDKNVENTKELEQENLDEITRNHNEVVNLEINPKCQSTIESSVSNGDEEIETNEKVIRSSSSASIEIIEEKDISKTIAPEIDANTLECVGEITVEETTITEVINVQTDQKTENLCNVNQSEETTPVITYETCKIIEEFVTEDIAQQNVIETHKNNVDAIVNHEKLDRDTENQSNEKNNAEDIKPVLENGIENQDKILTTVTMEEPVDHEEIITTVIDEGKESEKTDDNKNATGKQNGIGESENGSAFSEIITIDDDDDVSTTAHVEHTEENGNIEIIVINASTVKESNSVAEKDPLAASNDDEADCNGTVKGAQVEEGKEDEAAQEKLNRKVNIDALHSITNSNIPHLPNYDEFTAPSLIDTIDLPSEIRTDLLVLLQSPRVKLLSWVLPWTELERNCRKLLQKEVKLTLVRRSLAGANDYLQYLNLDYEQFKHLPEIEYPGIEKGYEMYSIDDDDDDDDDDDEDIDRRNVDSDMQSDTSDSLYDYKARRTKTNRRRFSRIRNTRVRHPRRNVIRSSSEYENYMSNNQDDDDDDDDDDSDNEAQMTENESENDTQQFELPNASSNETENQVPSPINVDLSLDSNSSILNIAAYSDITSSPTRQSVKSDLEVRPRRKYRRRGIKSVSEGYNSCAELDFTDKLINIEKPFEGLTPRTKLNSVRLLKKVTKDIRTRKLILNNSVEQDNTKELEKGLTEKIMTTIAGYNNADRKVYRKMALRAKRQKMKELREGNDVNYFSSSATDSAPERYEMDLRDYLIQYYSLRGIAVPKKTDYLKFSSRKTVRRNLNESTPNKSLEIVENIKETIQPSVPVDENISNLLDIAELDTNVGLLAPQPFDDLSNITAFPEIFPTDPTSLPLDTVPNVPTLVPEATVAEPFTTVDPFADLVTETIPTWPNPVNSTVMSSELFASSPTIPSLETESENSNIEKIDTKVRRYGSARNIKRKIVKAQDIGVESRKIGDSDTDTTEQSFQSKKLLKTNLSTNQYDGNNLQISIDKAIYDMNLSLSLCENVPSDNFYDLICDVGSHPAAPIHDVADIPKLMIDRNMPNIRISHQSIDVDAFTNVPVLPTLSDTSKLSDKLNIDFSNNDEVAARINEIYNDALEVIGGFDIEEASEMFDPTLPIFPVESNTNDVIERVNVAKKICGISNIDNIVDIDFIEPTATISDNTKICDTTNVTNIDDIDFSEPILSEADTCFENDEKNLTIPDNVSDDLITGDSDDQRDEVYLNGQEPSLNEDTEFVVQKPLRTYSRMGCNIKSNDGNHGVKKMCTPNAHTCGCVEDDRYISLPSPRSSSCSSLISNRSLSPSSFSQDEGCTTRARKRKLMKKNKKRRTNDGVIKDEIIDMVLDMEEDSRKKGTQTTRADNVENTSEKEGKEQVANPPAKNEGANQADRSAKNTKGKKSALSPAAKNAKGEEPTLDTAAESTKHEKSAQDPLAENAEGEQIAIDPAAKKSKAEQCVIDLSAEDTGEEQPAEGPPVNNSQKELLIDSSSDSLVDSTQVEEPVVKTQTEGPKVEQPIVDISHSSSDEEENSEKDEIQQNTKRKKKAIESSQKEDDNKLNTDNSNHPEPPKPNVGEEEAATKLTAESLRQENGCVKLKIKLKDIMAPFAPKLMFPRIVLSRIDVKLAEKKLKEMELESETEQVPNKKTHVIIKYDKDLSSSQENIPHMEESQNNEQNKVVEKLVIKKSKTKDSFVTVSRPRSEASSPRPPIRLSLSLRRKNRHSTYYTNNTTYHSYTDTDNSCADSNQFNESSNRSLSTPHEYEYSNQVSNNFDICNIDSILSSMSESSSQSDHSDSDETFMCYVDPTKRKQLSKIRKHTRFGPKPNNTSPEQPKKQLSVCVRRLDNTTLLKHKQTIFHNGTAIPYASVNLKRCKPKVVTASDNIEEREVSPPARKGRVRRQATPCVLTTITPALNNSLQRDVTETNDYDQMYTRSETPRIPPRSHTPITRRQSRLIGRIPNYENIPDIRPNNPSEVRDEFKKVMPLLIHNSTSKTQAGNTRKRKNLEMFQISSDDDIELELEKKPSKMPRLEVEEKPEPPIVPRRIITRRRTVAYGSFSAPCAPPMPTHSIRNSTYNAKVSSRDPRLRPTTPSARPTTPFSIRLRDRCQINLNENTLMNSNKRNFMFDIYSVSVKSDFKQFDSLFKTINDDKFIFNNFRKDKKSSCDFKLHCKENNKNFENNVNNIKDKLLNSMNYSKKNSKKKLLSRVNRTSELIYEIAAKLICKSINEQSESEAEKQKRIKRVLSNFFDYFIPEIWTKCRKYDKKIDLKKSFDIIEKPYPPDKINTTKIHTKKYEKPKFLDIISSKIRNMNNISPITNITDRAENERLFDSTSDSEQIDESLNNIEETCLKCTNKANDTQQLRNLYCQAIKKYPNLLDLNGNSKSIFKNVSSNDKFIEQLNSTKNNKFSKPNKRLLMDLPGFKTLEHFTAPSFHCLPIVRIVHSTVALDNINASLSAQNVSLSKVEVSSSESTSTTGSTATSTAPIDNVECNNKKKFENKTNISKSMFVITTNSCNNSAEKMTTNLNGSTNAECKTITLNNNINIGNKNNNAKLNLITNGCRKVVFTDDSQTKKVAQPVKLNNIPVINKENPKVVMTDRSQQTCFIQSNFKSANSKPPTIPFQFILKPDSSSLQLAQVSCNPIENTTGYNKSTIGEMKKNMKTPVFVNSFSKGCKLITTISPSSSTITKALPVTVVVSKNASTPKSTVTTVASGSAPISVISTRSIYEENYAKFIQTSSVQNRGKSGNPAIVRAVIQSSQVASATSKFSIVSNNKESKDEKPTLLNKFICTPNLPLKNTELKKPFPEGIECTSVKPEVHAVKFIPKNVIVADDETKQSGENNYLFIRPTTTNTFSMSSISSTSSNKVDENAGKTEFEKSTPLTSAEQVDNSTLEQLREFDLVLEQVKERSTIAKCPVKEKDPVEKKESPPNIVKSNQVAVINQINQQLLPKINLITRRNPKDKTNEIIYATACPAPAAENSNSTQAQTIQKQSVQYHKVDWAFLQKTPLLVVANSLSPIATSVSSPPKTKAINQQNIQSVINTEKLTTAVDTVNLDITQTSNSTVKSKTSSKLAFLSAKQPGSNLLGIQSQPYPQKTSKPQEDEQTVQRIYDILAEYAEQLRNSPDLNNKPAPRRRSNPVGTGSVPSNSKKRKILQQKSSENGGVPTNDSEQMIDSEDSSCATTSSICNRSPFHDTISTSYDGIQTQDSTPSTLSFNYHSPTEQKVETKTNSYMRPKVTSEKCTEPGLEHKPATILFPSKYFVPVNFIKTEPSNVTISTSTVSIVSNSTMVNEGSSSIKNGKIVNTVTTFAQNNSIVANQEKNERIVADNPSNGKVVYAGRTVNPAFKIIELSAPFKSIATQPAGSVINLGTSGEKNGQKTNFTLTTNENNKVVASVIQTKQNLSINNPQIVRPTMPIVKIAVADPSLIPTIPISRTMENRDTFQNAQKMTISTLSTLNEYKTEIQTKEIPKSEENLKDIKFQESLDDDYKDLGVDQPSTSELFPDADLLFEPHSSTTDPNEDDEPKSSLSLKKPSVILKNDVNFKKVYSTTSVSTSQVGSNKINENGSKISIEDDDSNLVSKLSCDFDSIVNETDISANTNFTMQDDDIEYLPSAFNWNDCYSSIDDSSVTTDKNQNVKTIVNGGNISNFRYLNQTSTMKKAKDGSSGNSERKRRFLTGNCYKKDDEVVGKRLHIDSNPSDKSIEIGGTSSVLNINKKQLITKQKFSTIQKLSQVTENKNEKKSLSVIKTKVEVPNNTVVTKQQSSNKQLTNNISNSIANSKLVNVVSISGNGNRQVPKIFKSISVRSTSDLANKNAILSTTNTTDLMSKSIPSSTINDQATRHILIATNPQQQPLKYLSR